MGNLIDLMREKESRLTTRATGLILTSLIFSVFKLQLDCEREESGCCYGDLPAQSCLRGGGVCCLFNSAITVEGEGMGHRLLLGYDLARQSTARVVKTGGQGLPVFVPGDDILQHQPRD